MTMSLIKKIVSLMLVAVMMVSFFGCSAKEAGENGNTDDTSKKNEDKQTQTSTANKSEWDLYLNGNKVNLPCTLEELNNAGVTIFSEIDQTAVLESKNESFLLIGASCGDTYNFISLNIKTGDDPSKGAANAIVDAIVNKHTDTSVFKMKGDVGVGSDLDDVLEALGDDYRVTGSGGDDIHEGSATVEYGEKGDGLLLYFVDGKLNRVEIDAQEVK